MRSGPLRENMLCVLASWPLRPGYACAWALWCGLLPVVPPSRCLAQVPVCACGCDSYRARSTYFSPCSLASSTVQVRQVEAVLCIAWLMTSLVRAPLKGRRLCWLIAFLAAAPQQALLASDSASCVHANLFHDTSVRFSTGYVYPSIDHRFPPLAALFLLCLFQLLVSGVLAVVTAGLVMSFYARGRISPGVEETMGTFWSMATYVANTVIFFISGLIIGERAIFASSITVSFSCLRSPEWNLTSGGGAR